MLIYYAISSGTRRPLTELFDYIRSLAPLNYNWNYNILASRALDFEDRLLFDYIRSFAPPNYYWNFDALVLHALISGSRQLFEYIRSLAPQFHDYNFRQYKGEQKVDKMARNLVDYEAGKTILETALGIIRKSDIKQTELFE